MINFPSLMVGDWVAVNYAGKELYERVELVTNNHIKVGSGYYDHEERISPVPLTEEMLMKNGYVGQDAIKMQKRYGTVHRLQHSFRENGRNDWAESFNPN